MKTEEERKMNAEFDCPVCHKRLMHIRKEECAAAEGDAWVCPICKHEWVTEFNGTIIPEGLQVCPNCENKSSEGGNNHGRIRNS